MSSAQKASRIFPKVVSPEQAIDVLEKVADAAEDACASVALIGGWAMNHYGMARSTKDIDIISEKTLTSFMEVQAIGFGGQRVVVNGVIVDVIVRYDEWDLLYQEALEKSVFVSDLPVNVVTVPYLVAMKLVARRHRDIRDIAYLLKRASDARRKKIDAVVSTFLGPFAVELLNSIKGGNTLMAEDEEE